MLHVVRNIALAVAGVLLSAGVAELAVRWSAIATLHMTDPIFQASPYEGVVYEFKPHARGYTWSRTAVSTNAFGLNDDEVTLAKPASTLRVAVFGDSFTFGQGVSVQETYAKVLEAELRSLLAPQTRIQVLNFGVPSYSVSNMVAAFSSKGVLFGLDVAILATIVPDYSLHRNHTVDSFGYPVHQGTPLTPGHLKNLLRRVHLAYVMRDVYFSITGYATPELEATEGRGDLALQQLTWKRADRELGRFAEVARARGIAPIYLSLDRSDSHEIDTLVARHGLAHVKMAPVLRRYPLDALRVSPRDGHPNARCHALIADELMPVVAALLRETAQRQAATGQANIAGRVHGRSDE